MSRIFLLERNFNFSPKLKILLEKNNEFRVGLKGGEGWKRGKERDEQTEADEASTIQKDKADERPRSRKIKTRGEGVNNEKNSCY